MDFLLQLLYLILSYPYDNAEDLFRVSMVCYLLEPIQQYASKRKVFPKILLFLIHF